MSEQSLKDIRRDAPVSHLSREEQIEYIIQWAIDQSDEELRRLIHLSEQLELQQGSRMPGDAHHLAETRSLPIDVATGES